jgi:hypothetical protein
MSEVAERVAHLEARIDVHHEELILVRESIVRLEDKMERRFEGIEGRMDAGFREIRGEMRTDVRWLMGAIAAAVVTVILAMFAKDFL